MKSQGARGHKGFNLIELLVTLAVFAVIVGIAIPSFLDLIRDSKARSQSNQILSYLHYARSEAVKRQLNVEARMAQSTAGWNMQIFRTDNNELLRRLDVTDNNVALGGDENVIFDSRGRPLQQRCIGVIVDENSKYSRQVTVLPGGKIAVEAGQCQ
ncbi:GspH/FimT family pseudopilin [Rheinheimera sp.]|uniref:GspH/FimT family pseudopilin n=1 Tax=Rheinheimera sp. TaxID=1869214 RepID=UPI002FDDDFC5